MKNIFTIFLLIAYTEIALPQGVTVGNGADCNYCDEDLPSSDNSEVIDLPSTTIDDEISYSTNVNNIKFFDFLYE